MKERTLVMGLVAFLVAGGLQATGAMDGVYVAVTVGFFLLCIAYAEGCGRL